MKAGAWLFAGIGAVLLVVLFYLFKPQTPEPPPPPPESDAAPAAVAPPAPAFQTHEITLEVREGKLVSGPPVIRVKQDDVLMLSIVSDRADELHIHGYDLHVPISPEAPAVLRLKADRSGRFDYELHKAHLELGALEVLPR